MAKNILIFADGTGQAGGLRPDQRLSNIYKMYRATRTGPDSPIDPSSQVAYYDPGLGTITTSGAIQFQFLDTIKSIAGMAVGLGFSRNVIDCYEAILRVYEPGDRIYLFGFSRGGYTVRVVANVLNLCGVPTTDGLGGPLPRAGRKLRAIAEEAVIRVYGHGAGWPMDKYEDEREEHARRFRSKYQSGAHESRGDVFPQFIGAFDSVAALGLPWAVRAILLAVTFYAAYLLAKLVAWAGTELFQWNSETSFWSGFVLLLAGVLGGYLKATWRWAPPDFKRKSWWPFHLAFWRGKHFDRLLDPRIPRARHALAIDETRRSFERVGWGHRADANPDDALGESRFVQLWFAGNHSDIGGSYPEEESRLSDISLDWMVDEALKADPNNPIKFDDSRIRRYPNPLGLQHCEHFTFASAHPWLAKVSLGWRKATRKIPSDATLHKSVHTRFEAATVPHCDTHGPYRPRSLEDHRLTRKWYVT